MNPCHKPLRNKMVMISKGKFISMSLLRSFSCRFSTGSCSSSSSNAPDSKHQNKNKQNNIFKEEICFEDINEEELGLWEMPKIPEQQIYQKQEFLLLTN